MKRWGDLEGTFHAIGKKLGDSYGPRWNYGEMRRIAKEILEPDDITDLELLLRLRSEVVHGNKSISTDFLTTAAETAEHIMELVKSKLQSV